MKTCILHWIDGKTEEATGNSISDAFMMAGYGGGALAALDYYEEKRTNERATLGGSTMEWVRTELQAPPKEDNNG